MPKRSNVILCVFSNTTPNKPQKKSGGHKKKAEAIDHRCMVKALAQVLVNQKFHSAHEYAKRTHPEYLCSFLEEIMRKDPALVFVMNGEIEKNPHSCQRHCTPSIDSFHQ